MQSVICRNGFLKYFLQEKFSVSDGCFVLGVTQFSFQIIAEMWIYMKLNYTVNLSQCFFLLFKADCYSLMSKVGRQKKRWLDFAKWTESRCILKCHNGAATSHRRWFTTNIFTQYHSIQVRGEKYPQVFNNLYLCLCVLLRRMLHPGASNSTVYSSVVVNEHVCVCVWAS